MTAIIIFMTGVALIAGWWLAHQRLASKPWLEEGPADDLPFRHTISLPPAKIGLGVFLAVAGALFTLFISAYTVRMGQADWRPIPLPPLLWFNTAVLVMSSAALQWASISARRNNRDDMLTGLLAAAITSATFLAGQALAWWQLVSYGYFLAANPANDFFYLLTAVHGLHLLGGVAALARTFIHAQRNPDASRARMSVELCAIYWHFLLVVWLILFALLNGWVVAFLEICRQLIT